MKKPKIRTCKFVHASDIVPATWTEWFWEAIAEDAPFSLGDNNHSLVDIRSFANHCEERLDDSPKVKRWLREIRKMSDNIYIDLEN